MALLTVHLRLVSPYGENDVPDPASGRVEFIPASHGKYKESLRSVEKVTSVIENGVMRPVELTPAAWRVTITPHKGNPWPEMVFKLEEGMEEPINLADLLPETVVNGVQLAKGDPGPVGPQGDPGPIGPQGPAGPPVEGIDDVPGLLEFVWTSGRRDIGELVMNGWTAGPDTVRIQRIGPLVVLSITSSASGLNGTNQTDTRCLPLPIGFRPAMGNYGHLGWIAHSGSNPDPVAVTKSLDLISINYSGIVHGTAMWLTEDAIPPSLPGDPA